MIGLLGIVGKRLTRLGLGSREVVALEQHLRLLIARRGAHHAQDLFLLLGRALALFHELVVLLATRCVGQHLMGLGHPRKEPRGLVAHVLESGSQPIGVEALGELEERARDRLGRRVAPARRAPRSTTACRCRAARRAHAGRDRLREPGAQRPAAAPPRVRGEARRRAPGSA